MTIQSNLDLCPSTVNVTLPPYQMLSKRKGKVVRFMMGALIRCLIQVNSQAVKSRVENFQTLRWALDVMDVLTEKDKKKCRHALGNCAESVPFRAMHGNP